MNFNIKIEKKGNGKPCLQQHHQWQWNKIEQNGIQATSLGKKFSINRFIVLCHGLLGERVVSANSQVFYKENIQQLKHKLVHRENVLSTGIFQIFPLPNFWMAVVSVMYLQKLQLRAKVKCIKFATNLLMPRSRTLIQLCIWRGSRHSP